MRGEHGTVAEVLKLGAKVSVISGALFYTFVVLCSEQLTGIFARDNAELISISASAAVIHFSGFFLAGVNIVSSTFYTATGDALKSGFISLSRSLVFISVLAICLPRFFGPGSIWYAGPLTEVLTFALTALLIRRTGILKAA